MTYEAERNMVLSIGVGTVIEYLQANHIWANPEGDMDPNELLNYTAQIVQAKEVSAQEIVQWNNPIKVLKLTLDEKDADQFDPVSTTSNETHSIDLPGIITGPQIWPVTEQGNGPTMIPQNSPMDNHVALLDTIGLSEPKVDLITEDDITPDILGDLVGQYIKIYKDKPTVVIGPVYHRIQFMIDDLPQPLSTGAVLALAKEFTDLGFLTDVTTSPFTGVENNVIHIGLMDTVIHSEQELIYHL